MSLPGTYKLASRSRVFDAMLDPALRSERRVQRILDSLRAEICGEGDGGCRWVRLRQVFSSPREVFRLEIEMPELGYQRTTLLERDALEELLEWDDVRARVRGDLPAL